MPTTNDYFEKFLSEIPGQSPTNLRNYRQRLRQLLAEWGGKDIAEIDRNAINEWHKAITTAGFAPATLAGYRQAVKGFLGWAWGRGYLSENPADHLRTGSFAPRHVNIPDERDIEAITAEARRVANDGAVGTRRAFCWFYLLESGARLGGLHTLTLREAERALGAGSEGVYRFTSWEKTGRVTHVVGEETADFLRRWLAVRPSCSTGALLVSSYAPHPAIKKRSIQKDLIALANGAGVKPVLPHALRHRVGDILTRQASPKVAQQKLNHKNITTTLRWYHNADQRDVEEATALLSVPEIKEHKDTEVSELARLFGVHD